MLEELFNEHEQLTDRQKKILIAAIESFADKGYAATSTKEIAQKAGVAEGTIFRHYQTKKSLLLAIVSPTMLKLIEPIVLKDLHKVFTDEHETFEEFIRAMIKNRKEFLEKNQKIIQILIQEIPFHEELRKPFIEQIGKKVFKRLEQIIEQYQSKGQIIQLPASSVIRIAGSMIIGLFITKYAIAPKSQWNDELEIDRMVHVLMNGLKPKD